MNEDSFYAERQFADSLEERLAEAMRLLRLIEDSQDFECYVSLSPGSATGDMLRAFLARN